VIRDIFTLKKKEFKWKRNAVFHALFHFPSHPSPGIGIGRHGETRSRLSREGKIETQKKKNYEVNTEF
jgi:hypothetical protein